jgi:hypothetical protein
MVKDELTNKLTEIIVPTCNMSHVNCIHDHLAINDHSSSTRALYGLHLERKTSIIYLNLFFVPRIPNQAFLIAYSQAQE